MDTMQLAEKCYVAWCRANKGIGPDGAAMPSWASMPLSERFMWAQIEAHHRGQQMLHELRAKVAKMGPRSAAILKPVLDELPTVAPKGRLAGLRWYVRVLGAVCRAVLASERAPICGDPKDEVKVKVVVTGAAEAAAKLRKVRDAALQTLAELTAEAKAAAGYVPPSRPGIGEVTATLRPGPDGVMPKVEPETVRAGEPIRPSAVAKLPEVPAAAIKRLLEVAWDRSTFRDADADLLGAVERWIALVVAKPDADKDLLTNPGEMGEAEIIDTLKQRWQQEQQRIAERIVRALAEEDPLPAGRPTCITCGARDINRHQERCPWRAARAWVAGNAPKSDKAVS